jgi:hypothetical protein
VHQPNHEEHQLTGEMTHDMKALAEMYLLSMADPLSPTTQTASPVHLAGSSSARTLSTPITRSTTALHWPAVACLPAQHTWTRTTSSLRRARATAPLWSVPLAAVLATTRKGGGEASPQIRHSSEQLWRPVRQIPGGIRVDLWRSIQR